MTKRFEKELNADEMKKAFSFSPPRQGEDVMGGISDILSNLKSLLKQYGCEYKDEIVKKANEALDLLMSVNIPEIPDIIEIPLKRILVNLAKSTIQRIVDNICAEEPEPHFPKSK